VPRKLTAIALLTRGMPDAHTRPPVRSIPEHDDFFHHHCVRAPVFPFMAGISPTTAVLHFLRPPAPKILSPICTLSHTALLSTVPVQPPEDSQFCGLFGELVGLYDGACSNQRTRNQFRPRNATKGTTSYQLRQYAEATLGGGSLRKIVKLPEGEDENEWLAVNSAISPNARDAQELMPCSG
jgi:MOB kinase activator 1